MNAGDGFSLSHAPAPAAPAGAGIVHRRAGAGTRIRLTLLGCGAVFAGLVFSSLTSQAATTATSGRASLRYADGAPPGFSGGFKEQSCHACHFEAEPNMAPGQVTLSGVPERFVAGQQYPLTVTLTRPGLTIGGFQLAARLEDGTQAGTFEKGPGEETRIAVETQSNIQYVNQKRPGADPISADTARWTVLWTAPSAAAPVTFNVAANAADKDESVRGDFIYTATAQTRPQ